MPNELIPVSSASTATALTLPSLFVTSPLRDVAGAGNIPLSGHGAQESAVFADHTVMTPQPSTSFQPSVAPLVSDDITDEWPLRALTRMVEAQVPSGPGVFDSLLVSQRSSAPHHPATYPAAVTSARGLAQRALTMASDPDMPRQRGNSMLQASHHIRIKVSGNYRARWDDLPEGYRQALNNISKVYERLNGWGLLAVNRAGVREYVADIDTHLENLARLRQEISEQVMIGIGQKQLSLTSVAQRQQQQYAQVVFAVYHNEMRQALVQLNATIPPAMGRRLNANSSRLLDGREPTLATPKITLDVQCGEQVALTYALLVTLPNNAVPVDQLCMITFSDAQEQDNHSVLLYAWSPSCPLQEWVASLPDPRAKVAADEFLTWCFAHRQGLLILDPWMQDSHSMGMQVNALGTNKCLDFSVCPSVELFREAIHTLLARADVRIEEMTISIDHPLSEINEQALALSSDETSSLLFIDELSDSQSEAEEERAQDG